MAIFWNKKPNAKYFSEVKKETPCHGIVTIQGIILLLPKNTCNQFLISESDRRFTRVFLLFPLFPRIPGEIQMQK